MKNHSSLVRFDWALKRLLRNKSDYVVLEGFLSTLLGEDIRIVRLLESEGNKENDTDKFNRVDLLAEDSRNELIIIEVQNSRELDYFHRILYGTSKAITEYIKEGEEYAVVRKVYSINIVYFDLGQGKDYVYRGRTAFKGIHYDDELQLSARQKEQFLRQNAGDIFPEYYVLRVDGFNEVAKTPLDEWITFLKTGEIDKDTSVPGLGEARERLRIDDLTPTEKSDYESHLESLRYQRSVIKTGIIEGRAEGLAEGLAKGLAEGKVEEKRQIAISMKRNGIPDEIITKCTQLSSEEISKL